MNGLKKDYKLVIIGDSHVGKTTLLKKFVGKMDLGREPYVQKSIERHGRHINLQIHDTMGQERFRSLTSSYYRGSDGCLVCFDVMNPSTFDDLQNWFVDLRDSSGNKKISVLLVGINSKNFPTQFPTQGNIADSKQHSFLSKKVAQSKIDLFREEHKFPTYVEVDLTSNTDIANCFETLIDIMIEDVLNSVHQQQNTERNLVYIGHTKPESTDGSRSCAC